MALILQEKIAITYRQQNSVFVKNKLVQGFLKLYILCYCTSLSGVGGT